MLEVFGGYFGMFWKFWRAGANPLTEVTRLTNGSVGPSGALRRRTKNICLPYHVPHRTVCNTV